MLIELKLDEVMNQIDSNSPAPGGGSVSALVGAYGVCLARMYAHLSIEKKKFLALDETLQHEFIETFHELTQFRKDLCDAADLDCSAYDQVMKAYKLPKTNAEEIALRNQAIKQATYVAIESPYAIMEESLKAMRLCEKLIDNGNKNAISDLACGIIFLDAAVQGAGLNVQINLSSLEEDEKRIWNEKMKKLLEESNDLKIKSIKKIQEIL